MREAIITQPQHVQIAFFPHARSSAELCRLEMRRSQYIDNAIPAILEAKNAQWQTTNSPNSWSDSLRSTVSA